MRGRATNSQQEVLDEVKARRLVIVNLDGKEIAVIQGDREKAGVLTISDSDGQTAALITGSKAARGLAIQNEQGKAGIVLAQGPPGEGVGLWLYDSDNEATLQIFQDAPKLRLRSGDKILAGAGVFSKVPVILLMDGEDARVMRINE